MQLVRNPGTKAAPPQPETQDVQKPGNNNNKGSGAGCDGWRGGRGEGGCRTILRNNRQLAISLALVFGCIVVIACVYFAIQVQPSGGNEAHRESDDDAQSRREVRIAELVRLENVASTTKPTSYNLRLRVQVHRFQGRLEMKFVRGIGEDARRLVMHSSKRHLDIGDVRLRSSAGTIVKVAQWQYVEDEVTLTPYHMYHISTTYHRVMPSRHLYW